MTLAVVSVARLLASVSPWDGRTFDPTPCVRVVNRLRSEGREAALAAVTALASSPDPEDAARSMFVLRLLFEGDAPPMRIGAPLDANPPPAGTFPLYPLALCSDVPLLVVPGVDLSGLPESALAHVEIYRQRGRLRAAPLAPPDDPMELADALVGSASWYRGTAERESDLALLRAQVLRLAGRAALGDDEATPARSIDPARLGDPDLCTLLRTPGVWQDLRARFRSRPRRWTDEGYQPAS